MPIYGLGSASTSTRVEEERTLFESHGKDVALEIALHDAPRALVDDERRLACEPSVCVRLRDDPRGRVRHAEVENLALHYEVVQAIHDFLNAAGVVPPVNVQDVDVVRAKFLQ